MKLRMILTLFIYLSFTILTTYMMDLSFSGIQYDSSEEDINKAVEFNKNYTELITQGKITFDYDKSFGTYCKAQQEINKAEFVIKVPSDFPICAFDIFPFKFELKDIIYSHLKKKYGNNVNETNARTLKYLSTYRLLYNKNADQVKVENYLRKVGKQYYINRINERQQAYLNSLPKIQYNEPMLEKEDRILAEIVGFPITSSDEYEEIHDLVEKYFRHSNLKEYVHHWVNDLFHFRLYVGYIASRAFKIEMRDYEIGLNKNFSEMPAGDIQKQLHTDLSSDQSSSCLMPFFDLCNTKINKDITEKDKTVFYIIWKKGYAMLGMSDHVKQGDEYMFNYSPDLTNEKLFISYGFYQDHNNLSKAGFRSAFSKQWLSKEKFELIKKIIPNEHETIMAFSDNRLNDVPLKIIVNKFDLPKDILNIFRVYVQPNNLFNTTKIERRIFQNKWLSYDNELSALSLFLFTLVRGDQLSKMNSVDILNSIQVTRNFYKEHREDLIRNQYIRFKYRLRRKMMYVVKEFRQIFHKNIEMVLDKFSGLMKDQFSKFRTQILLDVSK